MAKYFASDKHCVEVDISGTHVGTRTLRADAKGFYNVDNQRDAKALEQSGFVQASLMGASKSRQGFTCSACGFGSWFRKCSRCGADN